MSDARKKTFFMEMCHQQFSTVPNITDGSHDYISDEGGDDDVDRGDDDEEKFGRD